MCVRGQSIGDKGMERGKKTEQTTRTLSRHITATTHGTRHTAHVRSHSLALTGRHSLCWACALSNCLMVRVPGRRVPGRRVPGRPQT